MTFTREEAILLLDELNYKDVEEIRESRHIEH